MRIFAAARFGFLDLLLRFVALGDDVNLKADNGESALHAACESGQVATVQYLSEHEALLDMKDNNGNTALHVAVSNGHLDVTRVLVQKGANLCATDVSGSTALHIAAKCGYLDVVKYLADSFAAIDMRNTKNETALLEAAAEGHEKIVRVLIENGAGIGVRDTEGKTAFDIAEEKEYEIITRLLKDRAEGRILVCSNSHADIDTVTELDTLEHLQRSLNAVVCITTETEKINTHTPRIMETTPEDTLYIRSIRPCALHTAAENNNFEQVQRLVKVGIALDLGDPFGRTAVWVAAKSGHKSIIRFLLQNGSCVNIPDCKGVTPVVIAAKEGHWEAVDVIRMYHPTISAKASEYLENKLHEASESGDLQIVQTILKSGISVETTNN
jgi:ankyrin repeat protein